MGECLPRLNLMCVPLRKKYRSNIEIIALILEAVKDNGAARYSLMKQTGNNYSQLKKYLELLAKIGFIEVHIREGKVFYKASELGLEFLKQYNVLMDMIASAFLGNRTVKAAEELKVACVQKRSSTSPSPFMARLIKKQ